MTLVAAVAVPALGAAPAGAATADRTVLRVDAAAASTLRAPGLRVTPAGRSTGAARRIVLPVATAGTGAVPAVTHVATAGLRLRLRGRSVVVRDLRLRAGGSTVLARVGERTVPFLAVAGVRSRSTPTLRTVRWRVSVTAAGARALRTALRAPRLRAGALGTMETTVRVESGPAAPSPAPKPAAPKPVAPAVPAPGAPSPSPTVPDPVVPVVPPSPVDPGVPGPVDPVATTSGLDWTIRGSWLTYLAGGGGRVESTGAERLASGAYAFPAAAGTVDGAGVGTLDTTGGVRFRQEAHFIDMEFADFRFALDGTRTPTVTAVYTDRNTLSGSEGDGVPRRIVFGTLDLEGVVPERTGDLLVLRRVPVRLSAEAAKPFLYYKAGEAFGAMTLRVPVAD